MPRRTVVLFGLSANPPTGMGGHAGIVQWAIDRASFSELGGRPADEIWILPVFVHAFENKRDMPSFDHRLEMSRLNFLSLPRAQGRVQVLATEREIAQRQPGAHPDGGTAKSLASARIGTIDVVRYLIARHPDIDFALLLGADTFEDLQQGRWKESEALRALVKAIRVPRRTPARDSPTPLRTAFSRLPPAPVAAPLPVPAEAPRLSGPGPDPGPDPGPALTDISSTAVRGSTDLAFLQTALRPPVLEYIKQHHLYRFGEQTKKSRPKPPPTT
ncbi:MAG: hypothetical protein IPK13_17730 [Deltaproteobacteria bacterium]|nr:hypothetical protein [Deltaproteobacteria bacterium]